MLVTGEVMQFQEPLSFKEAVQCEYRGQWLLAMEREMETLKENNTWILENFPSDKRAIPCKWVYEWVYKVKINPDVSVDKFKARLVIKGYLQKKKVDYDQTFSAVARGGTIRVLLSIAASKNISITQFDVCTAFLYDNLEEKVFMKQPEGYEVDTNGVCQLQRSLYGLKQFPRCWNRRFADYLISLGFKKSDVDPCLFIKKQGTIFFSWFYMLTMTLLFQTMKI